MILPRWLTTSVKYSLAIACLVYAFWGVDMASMLQAAKSFGMGKSLTLVAYTTLVTIPLAVRLRVLCGQRLSIKHAVYAVFLCLGVNNILPAKLGEVGKAVYISRSCGFSTAKGLGLIFWERFFDLNAILILGLCTLGLSSPSIPLWPFFILIAATWCVIAGLRLLPGFRNRLILLLPGERLRLYASDFMLQLRERKGMNFYVRMALATLLVWICYGSWPFLAFKWMAHVPLSFEQVLVIFIASAFGVTVPSGPGGLGMYEAAIVFSAGLFGVPKATALTLALILHMAQFIPTTLLGSLVVLRSGMSVRQLRARE